MLADQEWTGRQEHRAHGCEPEPYVVCTFFPTIRLDRANWLKTMAYIGRYSRCKGIAIVTACDAFYDMNVRKVPC